MVRSMAAPPSIARGMLAVGKHSLSDGRIRDHDITFLSASFFSLFSISFIWNLEASVRSRDGLRGQAYRDLIEAGLN